MKMRYGNERQAVAPVLATLLMIAVAVAMSVIIFMWSQGFLSQTSSATGGQQGAQNIAAQSSISIEMAVFTTGANGTSTVIVRNVGSVSVTLGSIVVQGTSSNAGFKTAVINTAPSCTPAAIPKGSACTLTVTGITNLASGDVVSTKVTTTAGTFAAAQFTVP
jgi:FlaG/FlaF family flagellin (archaellin)